MPPREESGSFPDQYLMFDYDSVVAAAVAAQPQQPPAPVAAATGNHHVSAFEIQQQQLHHDAMPQALPQQQQHHNHQASPAAASLSPLNVAAVAGGMNPTPPPPIDPLSIDPTTASEEPLGAAAAAWDNHAATANAINAAANSPMMMMLDHEEGEEDDDDDSLDHLPMPPQAPESWAASPTMDPFGSVVSGNSNNTRIRRRADALNTVTAAASSPMGLSARGNPSPPPASMVHLVMSEEAMDTSNEDEDDLGAVASHEQEMPLHPSAQSRISESSFDNASSASSTVVMEGLTDEIGSKDEEDSMPAIQRNSAFDEGASTPQTRRRRVSTTGSTSTASRQDRGNSPRSMTPPKSLRSTRRNQSSNTATTAASSTTVGSSSPASTATTASSRSSSSSQQHNSASNNGLISLQFGPNTTVDDLKYFAERGCIVALLEALVTPRLVALGTRMLADYAKQANRRVAVASNKRILDFLSKTMLLEQRKEKWLRRIRRQQGDSLSTGPTPMEQDLALASSQSMTGTDAPASTSLYHHSWQYQQLSPGSLPTSQRSSNEPQDDDDSEEDEDPDWMMAREYAVETIRSLTATEESDVFLMMSPGLLETLALVSMGGPFVRSNRHLHHVPSLPHIGSSLSQENVDRTTSPTLSPALQTSYSSSSVLPLVASEKAQLHACIAIMNLSCGKANKTKIAQVSQVLTAMRDVMLGSNDEARLKATTCIKNLSNADANDAALLQTPGLVQALAHVAAETCCRRPNGATPCTTNACLALMNLSIAKGNKSRVFCTPGVMESLMKVLEWTTNSAIESSQMSSSNRDARIKACSALSNLAIGYDNKIPMFHFPGFVSAILKVIQTDSGEARTKACSILWSFAAEIKNQIPVVQRGDVASVLVQVAQEDETTEARFKCVAALTLLAESLENAVPLLEAGALVPLMDILHAAGADPTRWKGQTASWCVGFLMNIAQSDDAVPALRQSGVVELLAPLLTLDHYQSLKAAMAVTFCCRFDKSDECYDLLRKTENVIPKIINLLHNTLAGRGGNGYKYGVFTLRSSVGCIAALAQGPDFMKERIATAHVFESLLKVLVDFCVDGGTKGAIVGGGRDDAPSATLALRAIAALTAHLIPTTPTRSSGASSFCSLPFGLAMENHLIVALDCFYRCENPAIPDGIRQLALNSKFKIEAGKRTRPSLAPRVQPPPSPPRHQPERAMSTASAMTVDSTTDVTASMATNCCGLDYDIVPGIGENLLHGLILPSLAASSSTSDVAANFKPLSWEGNSTNGYPSSDSTIRTFLLADSRSGLRYVVPTDPSGGRTFNDNRMWCYRRGRYCKEGEEPDPQYVWTNELQQAYEAALSCNAAEDHAASPSPIQVEATVSPATS
mmetsp:Transcript_5672/g.11793  ORF Transcript_5672/g.11793 Transcript_5672/m.11793 type:complete len:1367 (+) Transcript_5672:298-4398(+)|eukprot:CAMPEP_0168733198 /NCGR_PEP_ID=MMETSP0724-20121128/8164_1 /TAXON_ID=265536 /ORGANISM="Amphiprora sp., Strain CCMP467" /LENGTH=1366 /DNA_ID=CAMNT_0008780243 /DNA_START=240 /DNA_END=4340 /DNA_ORIENTATION=-